LGANQNQEKKKEIAREKKNKKKRPRDEDLENHNNHHNKKNKNNNDVKKNNNDVKKNTKRKREIKKKPSKLLSSNFTGTTSSSDTETDTDEEPLSSRSKPSSKPNGKPNGLVSGTKLLFKFNNSIDEFKNKLSTIPACINIEWTSRKNGKSIAYSAKLNNSLSIHYFTNYTVKISRAHNLEEDKIVKQVYSFCSAVEVDRDSNVIIGPASEEFLNEELEKISFGSEKGVAKYKKYNNLL